MDASTCTTKPSRSSWPDTPDKAHASKINKAAPNNKRSLATVTASKPFPPFHPVLEYPDFTWDIQILCGISRCLSQHSQKNRKDLLATLRDSVFTSTSTMSEYGRVKVGKLKLKGEKRSHKKHKSKKRKAEDEDGSNSNSKDTDTADHGGWWHCPALPQMTGSVAIQLGSAPVYVRALDNGLFTAGAPHDQGDGPSPEEVLTAVPAGDDRIAFKSGYNKYLGVDTAGRVVGRADAIGPREMWQPVFQEKKTALLGANDCFLGVDEEDNVVAVSEAAGSEQMVVVRSNMVRECDRPKEVPEEERGKLKDVEKNYVKKFQKFQDKRLRINEDGVAELKSARNEGTLHEALLDRRAKMKADRYCK